MKVYAIWSISEDSEGNDQRELVAPLYRLRFDAETALTALQEALKLRPNLGWWEEGSRGYRLEELRMKL